MEVDAAALTLESDDNQEEEAVAEETLTMESGELDDSGQTGINLGDIDLSDLVHVAEEEEDSGQQEISEEAEQSRASGSDDVAESELVLSMESDDEEVDEASDADVVLEAGGDEEQPVDSAPELNDGPESPDEVSLEGADDNDSLDLSAADNEDEVFDGLDFSGDSPDEDVELNLEVDEDK